MIVQRILTPFGWFNLSESEGITTNIADCYLQNPTGETVKIPVVMYLSELVVEYILSKGYTIDQTPDAVNIIYFEGLNLDLSLNNDAPDGWNDIRTVLMFDQNKMPYFAHIAKATTEPGTSATFSDAAQKRGGVARIQIGQFRVWRRGTHKNANHPALVQVADLLVTRDKNKDQKRTGDPIAKAYGINQHGTRPEYEAQGVGNWSEGCLVGHKWTEHLAFIKLCDNDPNYKADNNFLFTTTIVDGTDFDKFKAAKTL